MLYTRLQVKFVFFFFHLPAKQANRGVMDDKRGHFSDGFGDRMSRWEIRPIWRQSVFFSVLRPTHQTFGFMIEINIWRSIFFSPENTNRLSPSRFQVLRVEGGDGLLRFRQFPSFVALLPSYPNTRKDCVSSTRGNLLLDNRTFMDLLVP